MNGHLGAQDYRHWSIKESHFINEIPLHDLKVDILCTLSARKVIDPVLYAERMTSNAYAKRVLQPFPMQLSDKGKCCQHFQRDHATAYTTNIPCRKILNEMYDERVIGHGL